MAHIDTGGGGRKASFELNLTPFIDLMSVLITFLLITAVWTQVSMLQIDTSYMGKKDPNQTTPVFPPKADVVLKLGIRKSGYTLTVGTNMIVIPNVDGGYDEMTLLSHLEKTKKQYPEKFNGIIEVADDIPYDRFIKGMDNMLVSGFSQIDVAAGGI